jgi:hypothetical protein
MYFNSSPFLPSDLSAHDQMQWQDLERRLCDILVESGFEPKEPHFVGGEVRLTDPLLPKYLQYSTEGHTWCPDCAKAIQSGATRFWQSHLKTRSLIDAHLAPFLEKDPSTFTWSDIERFFEDYPSRAPQAQEWDAGASHDVSCHGCGGTLDHMLDRDAYENQLENYGRCSFSPVRADDVFFILSMMSFNPGDKDLVEIAKYSLALIDTDGLYPAPASMAEPV